MKLYKSINELKPIAQKACELFLEKCKEKGLKVKITETYRSQDRQNELYEQGRTSGGNVVTWTKTSKHTSRMAWDICQDIKGKEYSDNKFFADCGKIAKSLGITWGGNWKTPDKPHFEVTSGWKYGGDSMTEAEKKEFEKLKKEVNELKENSEIVYHYTQDLPDYARPTIQKLLDNGVFAGKSDSDLALSESMMRMLLINDGQGLYDKG